MTGDLRIPAGARGIVLFAHGSGSSRKSSRNRFVASVLNKRAIGTLLFDLLTLDEEKEDYVTAHLRFNIPLLAGRLRGVTEWLVRRDGDTPIGYFGASTGAAAALIAAAELGSKISAVVSRGGRPDLAGRELQRVVTPTLLIVGGEDHPVIEMNESAFARLTCEKEMKIIPGATHLFEEPGTLEQAADLAAAWCETHLNA
ncbi:MAG TPA: dienelactone hydrolase family protein [Verrucomicrobiae bacterium]|nr:dienelactone hydrolase family protein [Verrucomicrobiae bacterium]